MDDTQTIDADALRARLAEMAQRARDEMAPAREETAAEVDYLDALLARQHAILTGVANALRGDPGPLASHSHHDLAERAAAAVAEVARLRGLLEVAQTSLAAATSGRRVTACDEIERLQRERDALRDAAREYLDARHRGLVALDAYLDADPADAAARDAASACEARVTAARTRLAALVGDGATMRRDLPAESVVSCPACDYGCTADLIDGAYVLRPHSRRETARVGLGGIVWCDGGTVRAR